MQEIEVLHIVFFYVLVYNYDKVKQKEAEILNNINDLE